MSCIKLGSKSEIFHFDRDSNTWICSSGLPSDVTIEVGDVSFLLHKFPLLSRSKTLENLIEESSDDEKKTKVDNEKRSCVLKLHDLPGGPKIFLLIAKFCYGVKLEVNSSNIVSLRCASEYLQMTEEYGEGNLINHMESFLGEVFDSWSDTLKALESCEQVIEFAEKLHIVSRCIKSLASKACAFDKDLFGWPVSTTKDNHFATVIWNGIQTTSTSQDWWYEDVSKLKLPLYRRFILAIKSINLDQERIAGSLMFYAKMHLPLLGRESTFSNGNLYSSSFDSNLDQKNLLEEIVSLLPSQKQVIPTKLLLRMLRTSMILQCSPLCRENLERRIGMQLDQASIEDILIPNIGYTSETLYEIDCVQRILDHFMVMVRDQDHAGSEITESGFNEDNDDDELIGNSRSLTPMTMVANLVDNYLAEVASDVNLKLEKFQSLAATIPEYARPMDDGIYRSIDIYLKAHEWLTDSDRELLCRLMDCQKLTLEASTHAAQNERLPLRFIIQVLFFEQLRLRTSVAGCLYVSENSHTHLSSSMVGPQSGNVQILTNGESDRQVVAVDDMRGRVSELEKECLAMKKDIDKLVKTKGVNWNNMCKMFGVGLRLKSKSRDGFVSSNDHGSKRHSQSSRIKDVQKGKYQCQEIVQLGN
ncbi:putative BTB/POZ domain-containing protein At5g13600 [Rutidosis leptorrhynchoides]|uniref:putative BTB/POZ domain-containing protein At5g13600 n=1 Tax=Rutidosis leptorrhynchoides TaxID=125765 RepID=UPI003A98D1C3